MDVRTNAWTHELEIKSNGYRSQSTCSLLCDVIWSFEYVILSSSSFHFFQPCCRFLGLVVIEFHLLTTFNIIVIVREILFDVWSIYIVNVGKSMLILCIWLNLFTNLRRLYSVYFMQSHCLVYLLFEVNSWRKVKYVVLYVLTCNLSCFSFSP